MTWNKTYDSSRRRLKARTPSTATSSRRQDTKPCAKAFFETGDTFPNDKFQNLMKTILLILLGLFCGVCGLRGQGYHLFRLEQINYGYASHRLNIGMVIDYVEARGFDLDCIVGWSDGGAKNSLLVLVRREAVEMPDRVNEFVGITLGHVPARGTPWGVGTVNHTGDWFYALMGRMFRDEFQLPHSIRVFSRELMYFAEVPQPRR